MIILINFSVNANVNGSFKDECNILETKIEEIFVYTILETNEEKEAFGILASKLGLNGLIQSWKNLCD